MSVFSKNQCRCAIHTAVILFCAVILSLLLPTSIPVRAETHQVIRVGYPFQRGMTEYDAEGNYSGYTHEYLQTIAQHTGYEFEYVKASGDVNEQLVKMLEMLENGEIDLLGGLVYSPAMRGRFDYIMNTYGTYERGLYVLEENVALNRESLYEAESIRIAIFGTENSKSTEILQTYMDGIGVKMEPVFVDSIDAQLAALEDKKADALLANNLNIPMEGLRCICRFDPQPLYFATTKGNTELIRQMNAAISGINNEEPYYTISLMQKYFYSSMQNVVLTNEEREYLEQFDTFHITALGGKAPLIYVDANGKPAGVAVNLLEYMAKDSNVNIEIEVIEDIEEFVRTVTAGEPDMVLCEDEMPWILDTGNYLISEKYMSAPTSLVVNKAVDRNELDSLREAKVGAKAEETALFTGTAEKCLRAIDAGEADYAYINNYSVEYYKNNYDLKNIYVYPDTSHDSLRFTIGVNKELDREILFILNKCINNIPQEELLRSYLYENTVQTPVMSIWEYARMYKPEIFSILLAMLAGLLLLGLYWKYILEKRSKKTILEQSRLDGLTGVYTGTAFRMFVKEQIERGTQKRQLFIMMDVDKFKTINDSFGHLYGDFILENIGTAQREIFDKQAVLGRAGGDEFILYSDNEQVIDEIEERCRLLQERLRSVEAPDGKTVFSLSIGGVITRGVKDYETLYKKADKVMYEVKGQGGSGYYIAEEA